MSTNDTLRGLLREALTLSVNFVSCQAGIAQHCMCNRCVIERINTALAEPVSGGTTETDDKFWKEKLAIQYCEQRNLDNGTYAYAVAVDAFISGLSINPALNGGAVAGRDRYTCTGKGGDYELLGIAQGAGTLKGLSHMVYRNVDGVMFVREPQDFLVRMEKICDCRQGRDACTCKGGE